ncbi:hypothetical protein [Vibrio sp. WXL103]|uniref:hypothetical protein n=1 Tax=Vibrio sp. WXL103 TaxID=3450710 RepID=UPI003EC5947F
MEIQQCWNCFITAEKLLKKGNGRGALPLFQRVLDHLPTHIYQALESKNTRPCQFVCLIAGQRDAAMYQSTILNSLGKPEQAYNTLRQSYALMQFLALEQIPLVKATFPVIEETTNQLLSHLDALCRSQHNQEWQNRLSELTYAHNRFSTLNPHQRPSPSSYC